MAIEASSAIPFGPPHDAERDAVLALCALASAPYDGFVWQTPERAHEVAAFLWAHAAGEVTTSTCTVWRDAHGVLGAMSALTGSELRRARLKAAVLLARAGGVSIRPDELERAKAASATLASVAANDLYLARIATHERARGTGLARIMMRHLETLAQRAGAEEIVLEVEARNDRARSIYARAGFHVTADREIPEQAGRHLHLLEMRQPVVRLPHPLLAPQPS